MDKPTNTLTAAALSLGVDAQDLQAVLSILRQAKETRTLCVEPQMSVTVKAQVILSTGKAGHNEPT